MCLLLNEMMWQEGTIEEGKHAFFDFLYTESELFSCFQGREGLSFFLISIMWLFSGTFHGPPSLPFVLCI